MKKVVCLVLAISVLLFAGTITAYAVEGSASHGGGGHHGGGDHRGGGHFHGGGHFGADIWFGPWWGGWGPWWWWGPPYYPYYPYYPEATGFVQQQPPAYVQPTPQPEEQYYWYFCPNTKSYYPYVKKCPGGWLKVVPPAPPDEEE